MTRRIVAFTNPATGKTYKTPEFNGDRAEFMQFMDDKDSCDADWCEIFKEFESAGDLKSFVLANERAQKHYHSAYGDEVLPVMEYACAGLNITNNSVGKAIELHC